MLTLQLTMPRISIIILCLLLFCVHADAQVRTIRQTIRELQSIEVPDPDTTVPAQARPLLTELKHQLRDCITEILNRDPFYVDHLQNSDRLQPYLLKELELHGVRLDDSADEDGDDDRHPYGIIWDATLERPKGLTQILAATTSIGIAYGNDTSLYLYKKEGLRWMLILALEENDYASIRSAQCGLDYVVSPPDQNGDFFVVAAHTTAWSVSNWQGLDYELVRPESDPYVPKVILKRSESVFLGVDAPYKLEASVDSFTLLFQTNSIDTDLLVRPRMFRFKVKGDHAVRISPVAVDAQGFLEEWILQPWKEVAKWRYSTALENAEAWQVLLHRTRDTYSAGFEFVQPCGDETNRWQIGLDFDQMTEEKTPKYLLPDVLYFTVIKKGMDYFVSSIDLKRPAGCPGKQSPRMHYDIDSLGR